MLGDKQRRDQISQLVRNEAKRVGRDTAELYRELMMQRVFARLFSAPNSPWMVVGGAGMLVRLPGARTTMDIDLKHLGSDTIGTAVVELIETCSAEFNGDPLEFTVTVCNNNHRGSGRSASLTLTPHVGGMPMTAIPVDLSTAPLLVGPIEYIAPKLVVPNPRRDPELFSLPPHVAVYPLVDQLADKICGVYQSYGGNRDVASTRWRDLADILLITGNFPIDAALLIETLQLRQIDRAMTLPQALHPPSDAWHRHYPVLARTTSLDESLHDLGAALARAGRCLNPILAGELTTGRWEPGEQCWREASETATALEAEMGRAVDASMLGRPAGIEGAATPPLVVNDTQTPPGSAPGLGE